MFCSCEIKYNFVANSEARVASFTSIQNGGRFESFFKRVNQCSSNAFLKQKLCPRSFYFSQNSPMLWKGTVGREPGRIGGGRGTGGGRRKNRKRDSQSGENREKRRKIVQYCITFYDRNRTKRREPLRKGAGSVSKR